MTVLAEPRPTEPRPKLLSIDEFMAMPDSVGFELVEGVLTERKLMGALADHVAGRIVHFLNALVLARGLGHVFTSETTYRCFGHPNTGRRPDASFIRTGRLPGEQIPEGYIDLAPDLAVEVVSPDDLAYEIEEKVRLYLEAGIREVWVVYPNTRTVHVNRPGEPSLTLGASDTLTGRGPLEGFSCPVADLFPPVRAAENV
jgi:Uma2 family endonuclease